MALRIKLKYHSVIDIITNSSSEIFCEIESEKYIEVIKNLLEEILQRNIYINCYADEDADEDEKNSKKCIQFWIEYGETEEITNDFTSLVKYILNNSIGEKNYIIKNGDC